MKTFKQFCQLLNESFEKSGFSKQVLYHGTPDARFIHKDGFQTKKEQWHGNDDKPYFYFTTDKHVAKTYADPHRAWDYQNSEPEVIPVHLKNENPMVVDMKGNKFRGAKKDNFTSVEEHVENAREKGHTGVVFKNVIDDYHAKGKPTEVHVVFDAKNIRHVNAKFENLDSRNIYESIEAIQNSETLYHGTTKDFDKFNPKKSFGDLGVYWLTPDKNFAKTFARNYSPYSQIMHVKVPQNLKIYDNTNEEHRNHLINAIKDIPHWDNFHGMTTLDKKVPNGDGYWNLEHPEVFKQIKKLGYDGVKVKEYDTENVGLFHSKHAEIIKKEKIDY